MQSRLLAMTRGVLLNCTFGGGWAKTPKIEKSAAFLPCIQYPRKMHMTSVPGTGSEPNPRLFFETIRGVQSSFVLQAAVELDVF